MCLSQVTVVYPGQAVEETELVVLGQRTGIYRVGLSVTNIAGRNTHPYWFTASHEPDYDVGSVSGGIMVITNNFEIITYTNNLAYLTNQIVIANDFGIESPYTYSSDFSGATVSTGGVVEIGSPQSFNAYVDFEDRRVTVPFNAAEYPNTYWESMPSETVGGRVYPADCFRQKNADYFYAAIGVLDGTDDTNIELFSMMDHDNTNYVRNVNHFLQSQGVDFTSIPVWNEIGDAALAATRGLPSGQFRNCALITPRHVIAAEHYHPKTAVEDHSGTPVVRFVTADNQVIERTLEEYWYIRSTNWFKVTGSQSNFWSSYSGSDYAISCDQILIALDSDLPASIKPMMVMGYDSTNYIPESVYTFEVTSGPYDADTRKTVYRRNILNLALDAEKRTSIGVAVENYHHVISGQTPNSPGDLAVRFSPVDNYFYDAYAYADLSDWYRTKVGGDSGSAIMEVVSSNLVYCGGFYSPTSGQVDPMYIWNEVQDKINEWGHSNALEYVDFTGYRHISQGVE